MSLTGAAILRVIEKVEELGAEVQAHLTWKRELLDNRKIRVDEVWADDRDACCIAQLTLSSGREASLIDPLVETVVCSVDIAAWHLIRSIVVIAIAPIFGRSFPTGLCY